MQKAPGVVRFELACASSLGRRAALRSGSLRTRGSTVFRNVVKKEITFLVQGGVVAASLLTSTRQVYCCRAVVSTDLWGLTGWHRCLVSCKDCACDVQTRMGKLFGAKQCPFEEGQWKSALWP